MTGAQGQPDLPTPFELFESVLLLITGAVLAAPMLPGFTLCVAGFTLLAIVLVAPLIAAAALIAFAGAILAIPYLLVRSIRDARARRAAAPASMPSPSLG